MLAHTAAQQGRVAANTILGEIMRYDQDKDCGVIFTRPEAAFVGLSVDQAKAKGIDAVVKSRSCEHGLGDNKEDDEQHGMIRLLIKTQRIISVCISLADHAGSVFILAKPL